MIGLPVLVGVIVLPYAFLLFMAWYNPVRSGVLDAPDYDAGPPWWQPVTIVLLFAGALAQGGALTWPAQVTIDPRDR